MAYKITGTINPEAGRELLMAVFDWICEDWEHRAHGIPDPFPKKQVTPQNMENQNVEIQAN